MLPNMLDKCVGPVKKKKKTDMNCTRNVEGEGKKSVSDWLP